MIPIRIELPNQLQGGPVNAYLFPKPEPVLVDTGVKADWALLQDGSGGARLQSRRFGTGDHHPCPCRPF